MSYGRSKISGTGACCIQKQNTKLKMINEVCNWDLILEKFVISDKILAKISFMNAIEGKTLQTPCTCTNCIEKILPSPLF